MGEIIIPKDEQWEQVKEYIRKLFNKEPDVQAALFLIGMREVGLAKQELSKEDKQDLMNLAFCRVCSSSGYFRVTGRDEDGWPVWEQVKPVPQMKAAQQEQFIRDHIILYFEEENLL